jgi:hypothetical protein
MVLRITKSVFHKIVSTRPELLDAHDCRLCGFTLNIVWILPWYRA